MKLGGRALKILLGVGIVIFGLIKYYGSQEENPYTGRTQSVSLSTEEEIAIGLQNAPIMAEQHGGLHPDQQLQNMVDRVGKKLVDNTIARETPYQYEFHLLRDPKTVNAFALPGGQIFITYALLERLSTEDQVAGVLGHEIGHVVGRHSAERIAQSELANTVATGAQVGADAGMLASQLGQTLLLKNGRGDELESDDLGVKFMLEAGYDPEALIEVMQILKEASGGQRVPEFQSSHPDPENRVAKIKEAIAKYRG
ncbi:MULTISPECIES: M48 family metalloprotease [unclassified Leeuwenhoekiella]|uniref:M48 family metalloprotease n=1 Tax=unclassified Leeuwenhoekiella TaxID=2615029 RepID=UPI000C3CA188|nr:MULTISPECIES: M48 family metalloprotease [unclassified Leeuwenhoekiella]MAW96580.1 peptidase M48 Ste24p [Leeuwenhoekiella sp.]MBA81468.1 peptidase M48 Ste24p [Leeuwenhoekiella sp.]|tara:strand:- start:9868 stop:10632 length:765 start_codon:yes stop_codon:yes gene_type:complete